MKATMPSNDKNISENDLTRAAVNEIENTLSNYDDWNRQRLPGTVAALLRNFLERLAALLLDDRDASEDEQTVAEERLGVAFDQLIDELRRCRRVRHVLCSTAQGRRMRATTALGELIRRDGEGELAEALEKLLWITKPSV